jgi:hypothetical protein
MVQYKKYSEKDNALARRFQLVKVEEPSEEKTLLMLRSVARCSRRTTACGFSTTVSTPRCICRIDTFRTASFPTKP